MHFAVVTPLLHSVDQHKYAQQALGCSRSWCSFFTMYLMSSSHSWNRWFLWMIAKQKILCVSCVEFGLNREWLRSLIVWFDSGLVSLAFRSQAIISSFIYTLEGNARLILMLLRRPIHVKTAYAAIEMRLYLYKYVMLTYACFSAIIKYFSRLGNTSSFDYIWKMMARQGLVLSGIPQPSSANYMWHLNSTQLF